MRAKRVLLLIALLTFFGCGGSKKPVPGGGGTNLGTDQPIHPHPCAIGNGGGGPC